MQPTTVPIISIVLLLLFALSHLYNSYKVLDWVMQNTNDDLDFVSIIICTAMIIIMLGVLILGVIFVAGEYYNNIPILLQYTAGSCFITGYISYFRRFNNIGKLKCYLSY